MSYHKVIYEKLFPYAPYLNERIGIEILVETNQSPAEALAEAKKIVDEFYLSNLPVQQFETHSEVADNKPVPVVQVQKVESEIEIAVREINECTDMLTLKSYWLRSKGNLVLREAYKLKEKQLQNG